jgi:hypothetical protein
MTEEIEFVKELPSAPKNGGARKTAERAAKIKARPGEWAKWPTKTGAAGVRKAMEKMGPGFEIRGIIEDGRNQAYVRYTAPSGAESNGHGQIHMELPKAGGSFRTPPSAAPRKATPPPADVNPRAGADMVTIVEDDDTVHHELAPFTVPKPIVPPEVALADAPVSKDAWRPKVKCLGCKAYMAIPVGSTGEKVLAGHHKESPSCKDDKRQKAAK